MRWFDVMNLRALAGVALALTIAGFVSVASADPITYGFRVAPSTGPLAGTTASGWFTFDSSIVPPGGGMVAATGLLTDLAFSFNGIDYDETTANTGSLAFDSSGALFLAFFGTDCGAGICVPSGPSGFLVIATPLFGGFAYTVPGSSEVFGGDAFLQPPAMIPEPGTLALLALGLAAMAFGRRRRPRS